MSNHFELDHSSFFTVVGAPYIAEHHGDARSHYHQDEVESSHGAGIAGLWLAFYAVIAIVALAGQSGAGRAVELAAALVK